jgi:ATP-dependent 26S proteasome regulatory subunit
MPNNERLPLHTIEVAPWRGLSFGERVALDTATALLWPLKTDDRMTVLVNLLADQIDAIGGSEEQVDAIIEVIRMNLKVGLRYQH